MPLFGDIIAGKVPFQKIGGKALVLVDAANWQKYFRQKQILFNWDEFVKFMNMWFDSADLIYYDGTPTWEYFRFYNPNSTKDKFYLKLKERKDFYRKLKSFGYKLREKPIAKIHKGYYRTQMAEKIEFKCNFDVEIAIDAMDNLNKYDCFVICSGDGDFVPLVKRIKAINKITMAISVKNRFNSQLQKVVDHKMHVNNLLQYVPNLKQKK